MSEHLERLRAIDGRRLADFLAAQHEFRRAFPTFFRAIGHAVCARLSPAFPGIAAHVGEDYRRDAITRLDNPLPPLDWVAFSFPGHTMWDLHVGVVARLDQWPPLAQVGIHWTTRVAADIGPLVAAIDWPTVVGTGGELVEAPAVQEIQQRDLADPLDVDALVTEVERYADRAVRYYTAFNTGGLDGPPKPPALGDGPAQPDRPSGKVIRKRGLDGPPRVPPFAARRRRGGAAPPLGLRETERLDALAQAPGGDHAGEATGDEEE